MKKRIITEDVLNVDETSAWLKMPKVTLYKLCPGREMPPVKVGRSLHFHRVTLEKLVLKNAMKFTGGRLSGFWHGVAKRERLGCDLFMLGWLDKKG